MAFGFLKSIVRTAGRGIGSGIHLVAKGATGVANLTGKVPLIGPGLKGVFNLANAPLNFADRVAKGDRIDRAMLNNLKQQVRDVKAVAPYAQMVVSVVPGIGTGISGAISGGLALASGQPIDEAIVKAVQGSVPGGPIGQAVFKTSVAIAKGEKVTTAAMSVLPLNADQKKALQLVTNAASDLAKGKNINSTLVKAAKASLPADAQKALDIGVALGHAQQLQRVAVKNVNPDKLADLANTGLGIVKINKTLQAGFDAQTTEGKRGFCIGVSVSRHQVKPITVVAIRGTLKGPAKKGFDMALAAHVGAVAQAIPKEIAKDPAKAFGFVAGMGAKTLTKPNQVALMKALAVNPPTRSGVSVAIQTVPESPLARLWKLILSKLGLK